MVNDFKIADLTEIAQAIGQFQTFFLTGHVNPDGDSKGSCNCLKLALEKLGKTVVLHNENDEDLDQTLDGEFCFIQLDVQPEYRLPDGVVEIKQKAAFTICIDHHEKDEPNCNLVYVDSSAAANALNVWEFVKLLGVKIDLEMATWAYFGLCSDTNSFKNTNTDIRSMKAAVEMMGYGVNVADVARELFQSRSLASFKLEKVIMNNLHVDVQNRFAFSFLSGEDFERIGATKDDADSFVDLLRTLECVDVSCVLRQQEPGQKVRGSIRAKTDVDVTKLATMHVGGGHKAAAGFTVQTTNIDEACETVKAQLVDLMQGKL